MVTTAMAEHSFSAPESPALRFLAPAGWPVPLTASESGSYLSGTVPFRPWPLGKSAKEKPCVFAPILGDGGYRFVHRPAPRPPPARPGNWRRQPPTSTLPI